MAENAKQDGKQGAPKDVTGEQVNTAVPAHGDHDRVQMLSLYADGTPAQNNPEIIGDPEVAKQLAREQFAQQAVSAVDTARAQSVPMMTITNDDGTTDTKPASEAPQDPAIQEVVDEHAKVQEAAHKAADAMVDQLHQGNQS